MWFGIRCNHQIMFYVGARANLKNQILPCFNKIVIHSFGFRTVHTRVRQRASVVLTVSVMSSNNQTLLYLIDFQYSYSPFAGDTRNDQSIARSLLKVPPYGIYFVLHNIVWRMVNFNFLPCSVGVCFVLVPTWLPYTTASRNHIELVSNKVCRSDGRIGV